MATHRYNIDVLWSADDGCWIADVPDLKYCSAHGDTPVEAIAEAQSQSSYGRKSLRRKGCRSPNPASACNLRRRICGVTSGSQTTTDREWLHNSHAGELLMLEFLEPLGPMTDALANALTVSLRVWTR